MASRVVPGVWEGLSVEIMRIRGGSPTLVGLHSPDERIDGWGDLDGHTGNRRGWWVSANELSGCIIEGNDDFEVSKDIEHRGVKLKGKTCRRLATMSDGSIFVEFDEDVNGCSADGLGKTGHCVALSPSALKVKKKKVKHSK